MKKNTRMKHSAEFKAKVALATIREQETVSEIARRFQLNANMVHKWKREALENMAVVFAPAGGVGERPEGREKELLQKIGELTVERDFLAPTGSVGFAEGEAKYDRGKSGDLNAATGRVAPSEPIRPVLRVCADGPGGAVRDAPARRTALEAAVLLREPKARA
jgi:transposase